MEQPLRNSASLSLVWIDSLRDSITRFTSSIMLSNILTYTVNILKVLLKAHILKVLLKAHILKVLLKAQYLIYSEHHLRRRVENAISDKHEKYLKAKAEE
jgi:hypothetical protein